MYAHTNLAFFVDNILSKTSFSDMRSDVGVVTSPGKLIKFPPTMSLVRCVSAFYGIISATILP